MSFFISMPFKYASSIAVFHIFVITQQGYELCHCWLKDIYFCTLIDFLCKALISYAFHNQSESFSIRGSIYMCFFLKKLIWFLQLKKNEYCIEFYNELKIDNVPLMPLCYVCVEQPKSCVTRNQNKTCLILGYQCVFLGGHYE